MPRLPRHKTALPIIAALAWATPPASAQLQIDWFTIDGGGATSDGGAATDGVTFSLTGTIGQPDAFGTLTGGGFSLSGGFWHGVLVDVCIADLDPPGGDGELGSFDLIAFLTLFSQMDPVADLDPPGGDGDFGFFDFIVYLTLFGQGCP